MSRVKRIPIGRDIQIRDFSYNWNQKSWLIDGSETWGLFFKATLQVFTLHSTLYSAKLAETVFFCQAFLCWHFANI